MAALTKNKGSEKVCKANKSVESLHTGMEQMFRKMFFT